MSRWEKIGFHGKGHLRAQGKYWSVRVSGLTKSHQVINLLSLPALVLPLLNPSLTLPLNCLELCCSI